MSVPFNIETSFAGAEISDGPHKEGLRTAGPNDFMFVYNCINAFVDLSIFSISSV